MTNDQKKWGLAHGQSPAVSRAVCWQLLFRLRLQLLVGMLAHFLVVALHHLARRLGNALLLDGLWRFLAGLLDFAGDFRAGLLAEAFARSVAVEKLFALGIKF